jgi:hypothetical protein
MEAFTVIFPYKAYMDGGSRVLPPSPLTGLLGQIKAYGENNNG